MINIQVLASLNDPSFRFAFGEHALRRVHSYEYNIGREACHGAIYDSVNTFHVGILGPSLILGDPCEQELRQVIGHPHIFPHSDTRLSLDIPVA